MPECLPAGSFHSLLLIHHCYCRCAPCRPSLPPSQDAQEMLKSLSLGWDVNLDVHLMHQHTFLL